MSNELSVVHYVVYQVSSQRIVRKCVSSLFMKLKINDRVRVRPKVGSWGKNGGHMKS